MLTLLARVGLRRGEVAGLRLDDIDWRSGELAVAGKGRRFDRVPLPGDVGRAIVDYLQRGDRRRRWIAGCSSGSGPRTAGSARVG